MSQGSAFIEPAFGILTPHNQTDWGEYAVAGGTWNVEIEGPARVTAPDGTETLVCHRQRWSFSGAGTFLLQIGLVNQPEPLVHLAGDDATPMRVIRETIQGTLQRVIDNRTAAPGASPADDATPQ